MIGTHLTVLAGQTVPLPARPDVLESIESIEVSDTAGEQSGMQMVLRVGRDSSALVDYPQLSDPTLQPGSRVIVTLTSGVLPHVLFDGLITHTELNPSSEPGATTLALTAVDVTVALDREEKQVEHPAQPDFAIVAKLLLTYAEYGLIPFVIPPLSLDVPLPTDRIPVQRASDFEYIKQLAERHDYVFTVTPGPAPFTNTAYWGPVQRIAPIQPALSVAMGPETNVTSISFQEDSTAPTEVSATVQDRTTDRQMSVSSRAVSSRPPLATQPSRLNSTLTAKRTLEPSGATTTTAAQAQVQAAADATTDTVTAEGEVDASRYRGLLRAQGLVGLRGVGYRYDGLYAVNKVTTKVTRGAVTQSFSLAREGVGSTIPVVLP